MMFKSLFLLAILGLGADAYALRIRESERPITKVINMLKEMTKQLVAEGEEDQRIFDQLDCWCKTQDKEKTEAIAENESTIKEKTALIAELSGKVAKHTSEIEHLEKDLQEETNSLAQAQK
jgi:predicted RNase H-like nuclease (RuvC/YqgF family)